jgi:hypothetical protein
MSVSPTVVSAPATEPEAEQGKTRAEHVLTFPPSGSASAAETVPQDEVKVQIEPPGEIAVYQFVNQQGTLVLQVPPQSVLNQAVQISKELAQEAAPKKVVPSQGAKDDGH